MSVKTLRIGTRGSQLALIQAQSVATSVRCHHPGLETEIVVIKTSGDWKPEHGEVPLSEKQGGKGLFAKEIEQALLDGRIDCGMHSMKDMPTFLPGGLVVGPVLPRVDPRDALISVQYESLDAMPPGSVIGTTSPRRAAILLNKRPDLKIAPLRGNVPTRLEKLGAGQVDGTVLAMAGLKRLALVREVTEIFEPDVMMPAAGQGVIGMEIREDDKETADLLAPVHCVETGLCLAAERAVLAVLDGSCRTPIGAYARLENGQMSLSALVAMPDGTELFQVEQSETVTTMDGAYAFGTKTGWILKERVPSSFLAAA